MQHSSKTQSLATLLLASQHTIIFTGAGISTESGIPDFRSPGGVWDRYKPIQFQDFISSEEARKETWRRKIESDKVVTKAQPNQGHLIISKWLSQSLVRSIITQNIDGLHQTAGVPEENIIELHGNSTYAACLDCQKRFELRQIFAAFSADETLPVCDVCGGIVKSATISFGQSMPEDAMQQAAFETQHCDLFIVIGSSLSVYPAAAFPEEAVRRGAKLVIINRDPTGLDEYATLVFNDEIGETLTAVDSKLSA